MFGDKLRNQYHIVDKFGYGGYSTVWLARDTCSESYIAAKVGIADAASDETTILQALAQNNGSTYKHPGHDVIPFPTDEFDISGPNGTHQCYTKPPAKCDLRNVSFATSSLLKSLVLCHITLHHQQPGAPNFSFTQKLRFHSLLIFGVLQLLSEKSLA